MIDRVARYSGLDHSVVDPATLTVTDFQFAYHLLRREGRRLSWYDARRATPWTGPMVEDVDPFTEAALVPQLGHMNGTSVLLNRYFRAVLRYRSDLPYQGPFGGAYPAAAEPRGDWMSMRWDRSAPGGPTDYSFPAAGTTPPLRRAMDANPAFLVLAQCGYHDLICHYHENEWAVARLAPELRARFTVRSYDGGHEAYLNRASRLAMRRDFAAFVGLALSDRPTSPGNPSTRLNRAPRKSPGE